MKKPADIRRLLALAAGLLLAAGCASVPEVKDPALPEEVAAFAAAMEQAVNPQGSTFDRLRLRYEGEIRELETPVRLEICWRRDPAGLRETVEMPGIPPQTMLCSGDKGWEIVEETSCRELEPEEVQMLLAEWRQHLPEARLTEIFSELAMEREPCEIEGVPCRRLVGRVAGAPLLAPMELFVGIDDHLIRRTRTIVSDGINRIPVVTDFFDYRYALVLMLPERQIIHQLGMEIELRLVRGEFDPDFPEDLFTVDEDAF